jgi:DDE superfamily endonuclease
LIEDAYHTGEAMGLPVWCTDQAGPFQTVPHPGRSWRPEGQPARQPHEYLRDGTAKVLTLFRPADGQVRIQGVTSCPNTVLHAWLQQELAAVLAAMPAPAAKAATIQAEVQATWERWQEGLSIRPTLLEELPPLRMLLVLDNLAGHKTPEFVVWLFTHGIMPLYTPVGGSWLNMAESIQRVLKRRALDGQHPTTVAQIMAWFEAVALHWNAAPTPFVWGGKRAARRRRQRERRHRLAGSGACTLLPLRQDPGPSYGHRQRE